MSGWWRESCLDNVVYEFRVGVASAFAVLTCQRRDEAPHYCPSFTTWRSTFIRMTVQHTPPRNSFVHFCSMALKSKKRAYGWIVLTATQERFAVCNLALARNVVLGERLVPFLVEV